ncbi:hypothetical protein ACOME3_000686 [Neoechinorhynchus agilis]
MLFPVCGALFGICVYSYIRLKRRNRIQDSQTDENNFNNNVVVYYGSQSGTTRQLARRILRALKCNQSLNVFISDINQFVNECCSYDIYIFLLATYGSGDPTDSAREFHNCLKRGDIKSKMNGHPYCVLAVGDSNYELYNAFGLYTDYRLYELGNERLVNVQLLDAGQPKAIIEKCFCEWMSVVVAKIPGEVDFTDEEKFLEFEQCMPPNGLSVFTGEPKRLNSLRKQKPPFNQDNPYLSSVSRIVETFKDTQKSCIHLEIDISSSSMRYECGDHCAIYVPNPIELIESLRELYLESVDFDELIYLENKEALNAVDLNPFPCPCSYRTAFTHYVDLSGPLSPWTINQLSKYTKTHKNEILLLAKSVRIDI